MNNPIPCWTDSDELNRLDTGDEEAELLTPVEKRLEWICSEWELAHESDTYEVWHDIKMMLHGASMALIINMVDRFDDRQAIGTLGRIAFEYSLDCIKRGKYEGAPK